MRKSATTRPSRYHRAPIGLGRHDRQELPRAEDDDVSVAPKGKEALVTGHEIVSTSGCSASQEVVIVRVAADSGGSDARHRSTAAVVPAC